ncbi:hypothetical protein D9758_011704 [Tetrapyrgos nigripes]|uniref:4Fe-4S ferredoxin-type domain-containing protein n=1 Tax=Tetrapyrgos nigripes TaxID=182062 RepID=A0A8H5LM90_9AGAR|nr:hypothetical protein D9758_011704 [Tetrapyrgos nigripes]
MTTPAPDQWSDHGHQSIPGDVNGPDPNAQATITHNDVNIMKGYFARFDAFQADTNTRFNELSINLSSMQSTLSDISSQLKASGKAPDPSSSAPPPPTTSTSTSAPIPATTSTDSTKPPTFTPPSLFKGKVTEVEMFIHSVKDAVELLGATLPTDRKKGIYMGMHMADSAKQWYNSIRINEDHLLDSFADFIETFRKHFGDSNLAYNSARKLKALTQTGSTAAYAARFKELLIHVTWSEESKVDQFYEGLRPTTKDLISATKRSERPTKFLDYVQFAIDCDNRVHERNEERKDESKRSTSTSTSNSNSNKPPKSTSSSTSNSTTGNGSVYMGEPMQVDATKTQARKPLTEAEKKHRKDNGSCMYCGKCGKTADTCPNRSPFVVKRMEEAKKTSQSSQ